MIAILSEKYSSQFVPFAHPLTPGKSGPTQNKL